MYQKYDTYFDTGTPISIHSHLVIIYLQFYKWNPSWHRRIRTLAIVDISVQMNCPSNCNSLWPYLRGGSPLWDLQPIDYSPARKVPFAKRRLSARTPDSFRVEFQPCMTKIPVLAETIVLYSTCKGENFIRCWLFQAWSLGMPSRHSRMMCSSKSESWIGSRIARYEEN